MARFFARSYVGLSAPLEATRSESDASEHTGDTTDE